MAKKKDKQKVSEEFRIQIRQILRGFRSNNHQQVYSFEANLSNPERAAIHNLCRELGLKSKSHGPKNRRQLSVYKVDNKKNASKKESFHSFTFSKQSQMALEDLFTKYPPGDVDLGADVIGETSRMHGKTRGSRDDIFHKPLMNRVEIAKKVESVNSTIERDSKAKKLFEERAKLPIASFKDVITSTVESHQVVLISGETGCGKTTQVPQFLLDCMWGKGEACKVVCTQPRRISATSVAERISYERGQHVGEDIGYKIRLEGKGGRQSSIVFCTNGVLLRVLVSTGTSRSKNESSNVRGKEDVSHITHIIVDEVHERDRYSDFLLAIIRDMLPSHPHLRLILMSATLDSDRFSQYFGGCPIIRVPGFTYPVKTFYLEDVLSILKSTGDNHLDSLSIDRNGEQELTDEEKFTFDEAINFAWLNDEFDPLLDVISSKGATEVYNYQHSLTGLTPLMVFAGKGREDEVCLLLSFGANCHLKAKDGMTALELAERENQQETAEILRAHIGSVLSNSNGRQELLDNYLSTINPELIDVVLIEHLLKKICMDSKDGAILVFLPGWDDINRVRERLLANTFFKDVSKFEIIALHSMVPLTEQKKVFKRCCLGCRKIVLSTNIAESAITIDDVIYVIDSGRMKEKSYDPYNNVSTLQSSWVSKASAKQREGRAGRCKPGICYHLYSRLRAASLPEFQVPEIRRMPIEELCLQVKLLDPNCKIEEFLCKTLDPPISETIQNAVIVLQDIGALSHDENLTELGEKLGCLPVHPLTSKMLFFAILMNCLDPALTLACASDYRDPFTLPVSPIDKKKAEAAKIEVASMYDGHSDQLAVIAAFELWNNARRRGLEARFCSEYFVSSSTMHMLFRMRRQLESDLIRNGFIEGDISRYSLNARDRGILHAVLVAGLYPNVGRFLPPKNGKRSVVETPTGAKVRLHPHSLNFRQTFKKTGDCRLITYDEITRGDGGMHIKNCTIFAELPLLLLATEIVVAPANSTEDDNGDVLDDDNSDSDYCSDEAANEFDVGNNDMEEDCKPGRQHETIMSSPDNCVTVVVDRWLYFSTTAIVVAQIYCLRERLSAAILYLVRHPRNVLPPHLGASLYAIACILSHDGQSSIPPLKNSVNPSSSLVQASESSKSAPGRVGSSKNPNCFLESLMSHDTTQQAKPSRNHRGSARRFKRKPNGHGPTSS